MVFPVVQMGVVRLIDILKFPDLAHLIWGTFVYINLYKVSSILSRNDFHQLTSVDSNHASQL